MLGGFPRPQLQSAPLFFQLWNFRIVILLSRPQQRIPTCAWLNRATSAEFAIVDLALGSLIPMDRICAFHSLPWGAR